MKVALVTGTRSAQPMGLELAEEKLINALRVSAHAKGFALDVRVVGGRGARRYAARLGARWIPAPPGRSGSLAWYAADLVHLAGLDLQPPSRKPYVATVYDLSPLHFADEGQLPTWLPNVLQDASLLLVPSAFTATELNEHFGVSKARIRIFRLGAVFDAKAAKPLDHDELRAMRIEPPFALRYGGYTTRKNVSLLLKAWARIPFGTLVLAGPVQPTRAQILANAPSLDRIVVLDYVPQALLTRLLRTADALVSTSIYEGFGLPPLEAMAAGTPVVAVAAPFTTEVCGDAALLVEETARAVADAVCQVFVDQALASRLRVAGSSRAAGFAWQEAAASVIRAYESAAPGGSRSPAAFDGSGRNDSAAN
jgi:glycosyltransferase involved in cell wall biosynthesis